MSISSLSLQPLEPSSARVGLQQTPCRVPAGFPSPATDYLEERIDIARELVKNPTATFLARVQGDSMRDAQVFDGDYLLIDRSLEPRNGSMVLAWVDGGFTVKFLRKTETGCLLQAANPEYPDQEFDEDAGARLWGVVTYVIHACAGS